MSTASEIEQTRVAIQGLHGCDSIYVETVPVHETFKGATVWQGEVMVFDLIAHPKAKRAYAWSHETEGGKRRFWSVLGLPPVASAADAVRASIVSEAKATRG